MSSLFETKSNNKPQSDYNAEDIEVLEGLEPVRRRPGMYIGGTDQKALHHLVAEILDNSMDEVVAGHASEIKVTIHADNRVTISDNGRGIPVDPHPKFPDKSALEVILTTLHSGGKFSSKSYETSGGLHGVGMSVVNALSDDLNVTIWRNGTEYTQSYSRGMVMGPINEQPCPPRKKGTEITFHPDAEIFNDLCFIPKDLFQLVKSKAYLQKGVKIHWANKDQPNELAPASYVFHFPKGIEDYLTHGQEDVDPNTIFSGDGVFPDKQGRMEWALQWLVDSYTQDDEISLLTFCNTIPTPLGGTHEAGFKAAILKAVKEFGERFNKKAAQITHDDIDLSTRAVMSCFIPQPQFQGQTKEKLVSQQATRLVENVVKNSLDHWFVEHPSNAERIISALIERSDERLRKRMDKEVSRASATKRLRLPGKLADCTKTNPADCELFIVEGDSAGGTAKQARARQFQAILPLRGKILNVATASLDKLKANQQIQDLLLALGCGTGKACDPSKLRYHKIIIMTDADVDGAHIAALLMTFFYQELKPILHAGYVYIAMPPLYRLSGAGKSIYAQDDAEKDHLLKTFFKKGTKIEINRFKGLGEMPMEQLRATTMDPVKRKLLKVDIQNSQDLERFVDDLMGKNVTTRFDFITKNAQFVKDLDI
ncbi:MAG: DNA topoisomerase IV subunit B [Alphaproteobacteria bacterium]|nr:DNA topoisomerase IV subunit B [Alphaproteobacteria bacterium]